jgi:polyisoprenoid-binding protein YceI
MSISDISTTGLVAGTWNIDNSHSEVGFTVRHLMSKVRGAFTEFSGTFVTTENPLESSIDVTIVSSSITTHNEQRDAHLPPLTSSTRRRAASSASSAPPSARPPTGTSSPAT